MRSCLNIPFAHDGEVWRWVVDAIGRYAVSDFGRTASFLSGEPALLACSPNEEGYPVVSIYYRPGQRRVRHVHALVAEAFIGQRPDGMEVAHKNGRPADCRLSNLVYATPVAGPL